VNSSVKISLLILFVAFLLLPGILNYVQNNQKMQLTSNTIKHVSSLPTADKVINKKIMTASSASPLERKVRILDMKKFCIAQYS
jgi:hypothetical protein